MQAKGWRSKVQGMANWKWNNLLVLMQSRGGQGASDQWIKRGEKALYPLPLCCFECYVR